MTKIYYIKFIKIKLKMLSFFLKKPARQIKLSNVAFDIYMININISATC